MKLKIELDPITALEVRVALYVNAVRWEETAQKYDGERAGIRDLFRKKADHAFGLMNEFREATGEAPYTVEYIRGERDE